MTRRGPSRLTRAVRLSRAEYGEPGRGRGPHVLQWVCLLAVGLAVPLAPAQAHPQGPVRARVAGQDEAGCFRDVEPRFRRVAAMGEEQLESPRLLLDAEGRGYLFGMPIVPPRDHLPGTPVRRRLGDAVLVRWPDDRRVPLPEQGTVHLWPVGDLVPGGGLTLAWGSDRRLGMRALAEGFAFPPGDPEPQPRPLDAVWWARWTPGEGWTRATQVFSDLDRVPSFDGELDLIHSRDGETYLAAATGLGGHVYVARLGPDAARDTLHLSMGDAPRMVATGGGLVVAIAGLEPYGPARNGSVYVARGRTGRWEDFRLLEPSIEGEASGVHLMADATGTLHLVWQERGASEGWWNGLRYVRLDPDLNVVFQAPPPGELGGLYQLQAALDLCGDLHVVYKKGLFGPEPSLVHLRYDTRSGRWTKPRTILDGSAAGGLAIAATPRGVYAVTGRAEGGPRGERRLSTVLVTLAERH